MSGAATLQTLEAYYRAAEATGRWAFTPVTPAFVSAVGLLADNDTGGLPGDALVGGEG